MKRPIIYPYKIGSGSARALAAGLRASGHRSKRVRPDGTYRPFNNHLIINWGMSTPPVLWGNVDNVAVPWLNTIGAVNNASNKLRAFELMRDGGVQIPYFTTEMDEARIVNDEHKVLCRTQLNGHSGAGITLVDVDGELVDAPLYVKYMKKRDEFRVHVFRGAIIDIQQKRKKSEEEDVDYQVRSYNNGWVFCRENVNPHQSVREQAILAVQSLGLDFGAVDVIWNDHYQAAYVLEVNTAPGLEGATVDSYVGAIENFMENL